MHIATSDWPCRIFPLRTAPPPYHPQSPIPPHQHIEPNLASAAIRSRCTLCAGVSAIRGLYGSDRNSDRNHEATEETVEVDFTDPVSEEEEEVGFGWNHDLSHEDVEEA